MRWQVVVGLAALALGVTAYALDIPRFVWGLFRYGGQRKAGTLSVGDAAPDVVLHELVSGAERRLAQWVGDRPLVLIFGSCT